MKKTMTIFGMTLAIILATGSAWAANVAKIGSTNYTSLQAALNAVQDGETITVLQDITQDDGILFNHEGVSAKLDLNEKTLTVNNGSNINNRAIKINSGTLEVYGGTVVAVGAGTTSSNGTGCYGAFRVEANGVLNAHDLTLSNARPYGLNVKVLGGAATLERVTINSSYGGGIEVTEATLGTHSKAGSATLTDCTFTQTGYYDHCSTCLSVSGGSTLTINSGTYTSDNYALYVFSSGGMINVNGGTFSGNKGGVAIIAAIDTATYPQYVGGLNITGGKFTGGYSITSPAYMAVSGGIYSVDPSAYTATDRKVVANTDSETSAAYPYAVVEVEYVAQIGDVKYETLAEAVAAANASAATTITLLKDVTLTETIEINRPSATGATKALTFDLNGHNITATDCRALWVKIGYVKVDGSGTVSSVKTSGSAFSADSSVVRVGWVTESPVKGKTATFELGASVTVSTDYCYGVTVFGNNVPQINNTAAQIFKCSGTVAVTGTVPAISGNGTSTLTRADITINAGATVSATSDYAIYFPQRGTLTVNGTVTGQGGVEMKAGTLKTSATTIITATGTPSHPGVNNNGTSTSGYAVAFVENNNYYGYGSSSNTFTAGTFNGTFGFVVDNELDSSKVVTTPIGIYGSCAIGAFVKEADAQLPVLVSGGLFGTEVPAAYVAPKSVCKANTDPETSATYPWTVVDAVAQIGDVKYETFAEAIAAANTAEIDEITILDNTTVSPNDDWKVEDGKLVRIAYVAQIGDKKYATLASAMAAVQDGETVQMIADEAIDIAGNAMQIAVGKNVVLDLNGHEVVGFCSTGEYSAMILNNGTLTIVDSTDVDADGTGEGKLMYSASPSWNWSGVDGDYSGSYASNLIANNGTVCVESGFLEVTNPAGKISSASYVIDTAPGGSVVITGGKLISSCSDVIRMRVSNSAESVLNISGGSVVALLPSKRAIWLQAYSSNAKSTVNVSGGLISGSMYSIQDDSSGSYAKDTITGGTFSGFIYTTAELDISGGAFNGGYGGSTVYSVMAYGSKTSISGGVFYGFAAFYSGANSLDWSVTGGAFSYGGPYQYAGYTSEEFVRGGIYDYEPRYLAPGYVVANNTDPDTKVAYPYAVILPVASITADDKTVYYATFEDAIDDADDSVVITVIGYDAATMVAPDGWKFVTENDVTTLVRAHYVAQIGNVKFESLQEAIDAAADGDTVELLTDCAVSGQVSVDKSITIDGNGYTVTSGDDWTGNYVFYVMEEATATAPISCTIKDINIVSTTHQVVFLLNENENVGNVLNLKNVDVVCDGECVYSNGRATINAEDCKFMHEGVYATGKDNVYYSALVVGYSGVINATNCVVTSFGNGASTFPSGGKITLVGTDITVSAVEGIANSGYALWARNEDYTNYPQYLSDSVIEVESGSIRGELKITDKYTSGDKNLYAPIIKISGGCFSQYIADDTGYIVEGKTCTTKLMSNGLYRVVDAATVTFAAGTDAPSSATMPAAIKYPSGDAAELALGVPNYSSEDITFGGWKMSDNKVVAALPAGTTGDQTLTATWVKATKIEVVTDSTKPEETVEVKVTDEWVDANVTKAGETAAPAEIKAALEAKQNNNLTGLENYVLGLDGRDPNAKVKVDSEIGASETAVPVVNTLKQTVDTGFKVQYSLDKVSGSDSGATVEEAGQKQDTSDLSLDLTKVADTQDGVGYYKMTATITKEGVEGTVSKVSSENTIGVLAVKDAPATTIIGVPWKSLKDGDDISVDGLVRTENLTVGDEIKVYGSDGKYKAWTLNADKQWDPMPTSSGSGTQGPGEATDTTVSRGAGVWLTRKNPDEPIYLMGQTTADAVEKTPVEVPAEAGKEAWTLVASPKVEPVKVADVAAGEGDIIRLPTAGAPKDFKYKNGSWGYTEYYVDDNGLTRSRRVETDDKTTIPAGRGFWYINKSTEAGKEIDWDKQTNQNN